jgi:hypothetical protein
MKDLGLAVDCYTNATVRFSAADGFCAIGVEVFESGHGEIVIVKSRLIQQLDRRHGASIYALGELFSQVAEDIQASVGVGDVAGKQDRTD